jgi:hypothetical protein
MIVNLYFKSVGSMGYDLHLVYTVWKGRPYCDPPVRKPPLRCHGERTLGV